MSDITVTGGGSQAVDTPAMQAAATRLSASAVAVADLLARLAALPPATGAAATWLEEGAGSLREARRLAAAAADGLRAAALRYGRAEELRVAEIRDSTALQAAALGTAVGIGRRLGLDLRPAALALAAAVDWDERVLEAPLQLARDHYVDPFADPALMTALQARVSAVDDYVRGEHLMEGPADPFLVDPAAPASTERVAGALADALPDATGLAVRAIPVDLQEVPGRPLLAPARSLAELGSRVPDADPRRPQVRIERIEGADGVRRFVVTIAGTATFSPLATAEPFDLEANLDGVAGRAMASERAVEAAMRAAGIGPNDPVLLVGHSQGALVATRLAQAGRFAVQDVVTLGGPTGQIALPASVHVLAVEHTDDPIPRLGGEPATGAAGLRRIVVTRQAYAGGAPEATGAAVLAPAHLPSEYVRTLAELDDSDQALLTAFRARLAPFTGGRLAAAALYRIERRPSGTGTVTVPAPVVPTADAAAGR